MAEDREAEELLQAQRERGRVERDRGREATQEQDAHEHERRSEKARYLREKLQERVESEHDEEA